MTSGIISFVSRIEYVASSWDTSIQIHDKKEIPLNRVTDTICDA